jgi:hypothetical protein
MGWNVMVHGTLVHQAQIELEGDSYHVQVYCREDGHHFARTHLGGEDIIINDGMSLNEVLEKHTELLPLAVSTRRMRQQIRGEYL